MYKIQNFYLNCNVSTTTILYRAFAALESNADVDNDAENAERILLEEYKAKLSQGGDIYPDFLNH